MLTTELRAQETALPHSTSFNAGSCFAVALVLNTKHATKMAQVLKVNQSSRTELLEETNASPDVVACDSITIQAMPLTTTINAMPKNTAFIIYPSVFGRGRVL